MAGRDTPLGLFREEGLARASEASRQSADVSGSALAPEVAALVAEPRPSARRSRPTRVAGLLVVAAVIGLCAAWAIQSRALLVSAVRNRLASDPLLATPGKAQQLTSQESVGPIEPAVRKGAVHRPPGPRRAKTVTEDRQAASLESGSADVKSDELIASSTPEVDRQSVATNETVVGADAAPAAEPALEPRAASSVADAALARIYSERDPDVTPPEPRRPQRLTALHVAGRADEVVTIELVINARGRLDSARATTAPRSVGESLLLATGLHAVKSWEFRPALKDGFPVSYRKLMSLGAY